MRLKQNGKKEIEIADWLNISIGSVRKLWGQYVQTGDISAKPYKRGKNTILDKMDEKIISKINTQPSITLNELIEEFGLGITESGISKRLKKMGYTFKKDFPSKGIRARRCCHKTRRMDKNANRIGCREVVFI